MKIHRRVIILTFILGLVSLLSSCAPAPYQKPQIDLAWPLPPDEPKIKFVDKFLSTLDMGKQQSFTEALFGEEQIDALYKPYGVAVDKTGKIYVTDIGRVFVFDFKNKSHEFIGVEPGSGKLVIPIGIAISSDGSVFVADTAQDRVFVYKKNKFFAAIGHTGDFESPSGVALDEKRGLIYVVDSKKHNVSVFSLSDYKKIRTIGKRGSELGEFNFPANIALDADGRLYVVDTFNVRIQVFDENGAFVKAIGKLGDGPGFLARPKGIAIDSEGHIYIVDAAFQNFQIFDRDGNILLVIGTTGVLPGEFYLPAGIAIDDEDKIYVVDQIPGSVTVFQYLGKKWKMKQGN